MVPDDDLQEFLLQVKVGLAETWMQRIVQFKYISVLVAHTDVAVGYDGGAHLVCHGPGGLVAHPRVNTSTPREHPEQVGEVKVIDKSVGDDLHGNLEVGETAFTNVGALAARPHIIVVIHIDIEDHFFLHRHECFLVARVVSIGRNIVHCSNINLEGDSVNQCLLKLLRILEAKVATVDIVGKGERKLSLMEVGGVGAVIKTRE